MKIKLLFLLVTMVLLNACRCERFPLWRFDYSDQYTFDGFFKVPETEYFARLVDTTEFRFKYLYLSKDSLLLRNNIHDERVICIRMRKKTDDYPSCFNIYKDTIMIANNMVAVNDTQDICCRISRKGVSKSNQANLLIGSANNQACVIIISKDCPQYTPDIKWVYKDTQNLSESLDKRKDPRNKLLRYQYRHMVIRQFLSSRLGD